MVTFHESAATPACRQALAFLRGQTFIAGFYLAGGTALALQIGHRVSADLDWFTADRLLLEPEREALRRALALSPIAVRALAYFDDAEGQPMPIMLRPVQWKNVRAYCEGAAKRLARRASGLT